MEESLLKSNFLGRDGFRWWIGQIPPVESQDAQMNKDGWGNRSKVRIIGYHPYSLEELPDKDLPWAQVLLSTTDGTGAANYGTNHKLRPGDIVFGFFLDGDNAQVPVIMGCFGRTDQVPSSEFVSPFVPFTGYTERIENDGSRIKVNEQNEQTTQAQKSPYHLPPQQANGKGEISYFDGIGDTVIAGTTKSGSKMEKIATEIENGIKFLQDIQSFPNVAKDWISAKKEELCKSMTEKIKAISTEIISGVVNDTYEQLVTPLGEGSQLLYEQVFGATLAATGSISTAHLEAAKAQSETIPAVKELQDLVPCLIESVINTIADLIGDMVCALLDNVENVVSCIIDQFLAGLLNGIVGSIISAMSGVLNAVKLLLSFTGFDIGSSIAETAAGLLGIPISLNCGESLNTDSSIVHKWEIGSGLEPSQSFSPENILSLANTALAVAKGSESPLSAIESITGPLGFLSEDISNPPVSFGQIDQCFGGKPVPQPPTISIFGGNGSGATAVPVFSNDNIIAAVVTDGGSGYTYPPFVSIKDNANQGYGAVGQSIIENGKLIAVVIKSSGEGYVLGNNPDITIERVLIENPGYNYQPEDSVTDNFGNTYAVNVENGSFVTVTPINIADVTDLPNLRVKSKTGSGAKLIPIIGPKKEYQGEVMQVIDCVS